MEKDRCRFDLHDKSETAESGLICHDVLVLGCVGPRLPQSPTYRCTPSGGKRRAYGWISQVRYSSCTRHWVVPVPSISLTFACIEGGAVRQGLVWSCMGPELARLRNRLSRMSAQKEAPKAPNKLTCSQQVLCCAVHTDIHVQLALEIV